MHYIFNPINACLSIFKAHQPVKERRDYQSTLKIMELVKPYFLAPYKHEGIMKKISRKIDGIERVVHRPNHGLAHSLRQGVLARDVLNILVKIKKECGVLDHPELDGLANWACAKLSASNARGFYLKIQFAASFQRSGRQSEVSSSQNMELYKQYEAQDAINFYHAAYSSNLFANQEEIEVFKEAILWENKGNLSEENCPDLRYLRRILHSAHMFDLRRVCGFDEERIRRDGIKQLLGLSGSVPETSHCHKIQSLLWDRSGVYLDATGDRDLTKRTFFLDKFFDQTVNPIKMVQAICQA